MVLVKGNVKCGGFKTVVSPSLEGSPRSRCRSPMLYKLRSCLIFPIIMCITVESRALKQTDRAVLDVKAALGVGVCNSFFSLEGRTLGFYALSPLNAHETFTSFVVWCLS